MEFAGKNFNGIIVLSKYQDRLYGGNELYLCRYDDILFDMTIQFLNRLVEKVARMKPRTIRYDEYVGGYITNKKYPAEFDDELKEQVRARDGYCCQICGKPQVEEQRDQGRSLSIHHIDYDKSNSAIDNLISLCTSCHSETNGDRGNWQSILTKLNSGER